MGKVNFKFRIGQRVYWCETYDIPFFYTCTMCDGIGEIINKNNDKKMKCPNCDGQGKYTSGGSIKERVGGGFIERILIDITKEDNKKSYYIEVEYEIRIESGELINKYEYFLYSKKEDVKINHNLFAGYVN